MKTNNFTLVPLTFANKSVRMTVDDSGIEGLNE